MTLAALTFLALHALCARGGRLTSYPAGDEALFTFVGRHFRPNGSSGGVVFDLEGTALTFGVSNASFIGLEIHSNTSGGSRLGVYLDSENATAAAGRGDPNPSGGAIPPTARVATLVTSQQQTLYTLGAGDQIRRKGPQGTLRVRVELLTEWSHLGDKPGEVFSIAAVVTDGAVARPAPPQPSRRLLVLGDSLSSGPGAGFTVPPSGAPCGDGVLLNDWGYTWNALLCRNFSAACEVVAQSGATITGGSYNIPMSLPWALGAMGEPFWPPETRVPWQAPLDAVLVELGENDCHAFNCSAPPGRERLGAAYAALAHTLAAAQPRGKALPIFFTLANHEAGQSLAMADAVDTLRSAGFSSVQLLNGTSPNVDPVSGADIANGCAGHPSAAQNTLAFARMQPIVAAVLGW
jgi:hypothetical protein